MDPSTAVPNGQSRTRRGFLAGAGALLLAGPAAGADDDPQSATPPMIIPTVSEFENNYTGQFLTVREQLSEEANLEAVQDACGELPWPEEEAVQHEAQLTDRRSDEPIAVRLPVFLNGSQLPDEDDALFIINNASPCGDEYVTLQGSPIDLRSITGGESGPGVTEDGDSDSTNVAGSGFGVLAGLVGTGGALLARSLVDRE